jgi:hypothetical protein
MKCTRHELLFACDRERVRELGVEPALMGCPLCDRQRLDHLAAEVDKLRAHRDTLLKAIDLKALLEPAAPHA